MSAFHVTRLTPGGVVTGHYDTPVETDGPWLVVHGGAGAAPLLIVPAHAVVAVEPCDEPGTCPVTRG